MIASAHDRPVLALTMGDVNGIGPEILARALARREVRALCRPVVYGSAAALRDAAASLGIALETAAADAPVPDEARVPCCDAGWPAPAMRPGVPDPAAGACAVEWVKAAVHDALAGRVAGLVTAPIAKHVVYAAGYDIVGHTELVADLTGARAYRMSLFAGNLRVVHHTGHCSLRDAIAAITEPRVCESIRIAHEALRRMGFAAPRVAVMGLNPHAGEAGAFGREEIEVIAPAVAACRAEGIDCRGPFPPDTLLGKMRDGEYDVVIAMYHDQGHIPMKFAAMDEGVNVTLGIPIVRTSVDHGTAFDIAGRGIAREHSLVAATALAAQLCRRPA